MKITTEPLESRQLSLVIEVEEEETQQAMRRAARNISKGANIPGFRRGKAPYDVVIQRFGEDTVRREAAEILIEEVYDKALEQESIEPYAAPALEDLKLDPITFTFAVPLPPTVELGDYRGYRLKYKPTKVTKQQVQEALQNLREQNAILEQVDRPVAPGDGVVVDLEGWAPDEEQIFKGEEVHLLLDPGNTYPAPDFAAAIAGMATGEERTFTLPLSDDFPREDLRGQEAKFTVKLREVYDSTLPALDDDLARTVGNFDSIKDLEKHIKEQLQQEAQEKVDEEYTVQVLKDLVEQAQVAYPPVMLKQELDEAVQEVERAVKRQTRLSLSDYLRFQGRTLEDLQEELRPSAEARLKRALVLGEVVTSENLEVNEEEINVQIEAASMSWGVRADEIRTSLSSQAGQQAVRSRLLANKAVQRLVAIAKGEAAAETAAPAAEEQDAPEPAGEEKQEDTSG